jgi:cell division transport system ATP-binding protein
MITFQNVTKTYKGSTVALRDCSVDIEKGEFVFLVGPSGSGKTTFIRLLLREEVPDSGRIWEAGKDIGRLSNARIPYLRRNIGCVFQDFRLLPNKTVFENVAFALEVIGRPRHVIATQVPQVLDLVGLSKKRDNLPGELSGGEQQRVAVARAFVNRPLILLADEPTGNLDPKTSLGIMNLLDRINRTGTTVVVATHDAGMVDHMRRRVIELDRGVVVRDQARGVYGIDQAVAAAGAGSPTGARVLEAPAGPDGPTARPVPRRGSRRGAIRRPPLPVPDAGTQEA